MRLLFLTNYYPPFHAGGYEELCAQVATGFSERGHDVAVLTSTHGANNAGHAERNVFRHLEPEVDLRPFRATLGFFMGRRKRRERNAVRFKDVVARFQPDIVMVWGMWNLPYALLDVAESWAKPRVVYYLADYWPTLPEAYTLHWREPALHWYTQLPKRLLAKAALPRTSRDGGSRLRFERAICASQAVKAHLTRLHPAFASARVIHIGVDLEKFHPGDSTGWAAIPGEPLRLLYAGRLARDKGVRTAIYAVARLRRDGVRVELAIRGNEPRECFRELQQLVTELGVADQVVFEARVPHDDMPGVLTQADALVFPSEWEEPFALVVLEAMASGAVVVGTTTGGTGEVLVEGETGLTFPPGNAEVLASQIRRLIDEPRLRECLARNARRRIVDRFSSTGMLDQIERYLVNLAPAGGNP